MRHLSGRMKAAVAVGLFLTGRLFSSLVVPSGLEQAPQTFGATFGDNAAVVFYVPDEEPESAIETDPLVIEPGTPAGAAPVLSEAGYRTL
jgi:hypothetical protein